VVSGRGTCAHRSSPSSARSFDLPEDYRAVVVLSDVVGLPYQEIADGLDVPVGTVRSRLHRGRSKLRAELGDER
ncbi:MAG: sigma factor-like helix-turn-helix DNA-binding protein, partial [Actinomycetota bacterium]